MLLLFASLLAMYEKVFAETVHSHQSIILSTSALASYGHIRQQQPLTAKDVQRLDEGAGEMARGTLVWFPAST